MVDHTQLFQTLREATILQTGPAGFAGTWSSSALALKELASSASLDQWISECNKPNTSNILLAYCFAAIDRKCSKLTKRGEADSDETPNFARAALFFLENFSKTDLVSSMEGCNLSRKPLNGLLVDAFDSFAAVPSFTSHLLFALTSMQPSPKLPQKLYQILENNTSNDDELNLLKSLPTV